MKIFDLVEHFIRINWLQNERCRQCDLDNEIQILSVDFEYENGPLSINGVWVTGEHDGTATK